MNLNDRLAAIPLDDPAAFDVLNKGRFTGIAQFAGQALQSICKQMTITSLEDMVAITALARPGPDANRWVRRRNGFDPVIYPHPLFEPILKDTLGVIIWQESVMRICREIGNLSWEDVNAIRRAMGKTQGAEAFNLFGDKWKNGARKNGISKDDLDHLWNELCTFGSYGFNRCLHENTKIKLARKLKNGRKSITIKELFEISSKSSHRLTLSSLFPDGRVKWQKLKNVISSGKKHCYEFSFSNGVKVSCTPDHKFIVNDKWSNIGNAKIGDQFTISSSIGARKNRRPKIGATAKGKKYLVAQESFPSGKNHPSWRNGSSFYYEKFRDKMKDQVCQYCGGNKKSRRMEVHHNDFNAGQDRPNDLLWLCSSCHATVHRNDGRSLPKGARGKTTSTIELLSKKYIGYCNTYDIEMPTHHNFILDNDLITHNSHAVAYSIISYWCCWLKAHHPLEFAAATLDAESEPLKQIQLLRELSEEGIEYTPVDPKHSTDRWVPVITGKKQRLVGPLTSIKGIGPATVIEILKARKEGLPLRETLLKRLASAKTDIDSLYPVADAVKRLHPSLKKINIVTKPMPVRKVQCGVEGEIMIIAVVKKIAPKDENENVNIMKREAAGRQGRLSGPTQALNLFFQDDTDEIFCKVNRYKFESLGRAIVERGGAGKALYAIKGVCPSSFRMIDIQAVKFLGMMDDD